MTREPRAYKPLTFLPVHALMVRWLRQKVGLTPWEYRFLKDIKRKTKLSVLQDRKIREIYGRHRHDVRSKCGGTYYFEPDEPFDNCVRYDDVHDFDR